MEEALVVADVRKRYGDVVALDGVSLSVAPGEVFGLIGPNGAGKTTLVRALTGTTPAEGRVEVLGTEPTRVDPERVGLLPQEFSPAGRLTPRELLDYYGGLYDEARDVGAVLDDVGLLDAADTWYENLSGGQRRRTCVGAALVNDPDVLFLDEPTTGIDPAGRRSLWNLLESLAGGGTTVFLTSHSMAEVERLADRVGLLSAGELVAVGTPTALVDEYGGESRLVVRTPAGTDALPESRWPVEATSERLLVHGVGPRDIGDAVAMLERSGVGYESLTWRQAGLEDVYLRLTGNRFERGGGVAVAGGTAGRGTEDSERGVEANAAPGTGSGSGSGGDR